MPTLIAEPRRFPQDGIVIDEFVGRISTGDERLSVGRLSSGAGWSEPAQRPDFDEYSVVLRGALYVRDVATGETTVARAGQVVFVRRGERIQYSTPEELGADYVSICLPAFSPESSRRDAN